ncbi:hypothetical protein [Cellulomonas palmilytica]|uniref:hypothetical protein n=1 Tax=Cellulomonas palmilytica TaxID=2608402 RepID=UPI001F167303|nr:hypothetical protein [Cellulomonas palmilytica]UJP40460.1 hypothetical protein F1D97_02725 [Cellulomonas palmilytica]
MDVSLPVELTDQHVLALPQGTDVLALARAWFADAVWEREPASAAPTARPMTGARFRGIVVQEPASSVPGRLAVAGAVLVGPRRLTSDEVRAAGLRAGGALDLYGIEGPATPQVSAWCTAAARHAGGLLVPAARGQVVVPDPNGAPGLTLWSPVPLAPRDVLPLVRPAMVGARVSPTEVPTPAGGVPQECAVTAVFDYDGTVTLRSARSDDVPAVLATLDWREYGPWAYHVRWRPADGEDPESSLSAIARQRVAPTIARVTAALWRAAGGTVVDEGGFLVRPEELTRRSVPPR